MNDLVLNRIRVKKRKTLCGTPLPKVSPAPGERGAPFKGIRIPESLKFLLLESRIREHTFVGSGILDLGIRNTTQGIRNPTND